MVNLAKSPLFFLAPMDDVTDTVFRRIVADLAAPDFTFTEFVNVDGLMSAGMNALLPKLSTKLDTVPVIAQIWGKKPENYYEVAKLLASGEVGSFAGIDINMGCPDKTIVKNGCCAALINNRTLAIEIIKAAQEGAGNLPVSVKTRLGFNTIDLTWHELLLEQQIAALTVHARTAKQMSLVPAQWEMLKKVKEIRDDIAPETLLIGNGDVRDRSQGLERVRETGIEGVMIGRGIFHNPYAFSDKATDKIQGISAGERIAMYRRHVELFMDTWRNGERKLVMLNKFCKTYIQGFDGAKELREELMVAKSAKELLEMLDKAQTALV